MKNNFLLKISDSLKKFLYYNVFNGKDMRATSREQLELILAKAKLNTLSFSQINLDGTDLSYLDFSDLKFQDFENGSATNFSNSRLKSTNFINANISNTNFQNVKAQKSNFKNSLFREANCRSSYFRNCNLESVDFYRADLSFVDFTASNLKNVNLYSAKLHQTIFRQEDIGSKLLWEDDKLFQDYANRIKQEYGIKLTNSKTSRLQRASQIYSSLSINWLAIGRVKDSAWAYVRMRKLSKKLHLPLHARNIYGVQELGDPYFITATKDKNYYYSPWYSPQVLVFYLRHLVLWAFDWMIEIVCNYGESVWRVLGWIIFLILGAGPILANVFGGLTLDSEVIIFDLTKPEMFFDTYIQFVLYIIDAFTTSDFSKAEPRNDLVRLVSGLIAFIGIFFAGLLGFIAGNKIRQ